MKVMSKMFGDDTGATTGGFSFYGTFAMEAARLRPITATTSLSLRESSLALEDEIVIV